MRKILGMLSVAALLAVGLGGSASAYTNADWTTPTSDNAALTAWVFNAGPDSAGIEFDFSGSFVTFPFSKLPPSSLEQSFKGLDNPAPLLWYQKHVDPKWLGWSMFGYGPGANEHVPIAAALIDKMNAAHFAPSMVGGYNVPGLTAVNQTTPPASNPSAPSARPAPNSAPASTPSQTSTARSHPSSAPSVAPSASHASASTGTKPVAKQSDPPSTPATSTAPSSGTARSSVAPASPVAPSHLGTPPYGQYRKTLTADAARLHHHQTPGTPWPWVIGGIVLVAAGGYGVWRWRSRRS